MNTRFIFTALFFLIISPAHPDIPGVVFPLVFDKPLSATVIPVTDYDGDTVTSDRHNAYFSLSCYYYPTFMVKEINTHEKGAAKLSITPSQSQNPPPCQDKTPGENIIDHGGYFMGAKDAFVFFRNDDSGHGALGITVYSPKGEKIFHDLEGTIFETYRPTTSTITIEKDGSLSLYYTRSFGASCSLFDDSKKRQCWEVIKKETGLQGSQPPCLIPPEYRKSKKEADIWKKSSTIIEYKAHAQINKDRVTIQPSPREQQIHCQLPP